MTSGSVTFHHVRYTVGDLRHLPEDEVVYLFMITQLHNDIATLLALVTSNFPKDDDPMPLRVRGGVVAMMCVRLLAGRLEEGWKSIKTRFNVVFAAYSDTMNPKSIESLKELRAYFSDNNLLRDIRDHASFHFTRDNMQEAYRSMEDGAELVDYISASLGNTTYFSAEGMLNQAVLQLLPDRPEDNGDALMEVINEVARIADLFLSVTTAYTNEFYEAHLKKQLEAMAEDKISIEGVPAMYEGTGLHYVYSETDEPKRPGNRRDRRAAEKLGRRR